MIIQDNFSYFSMKPCVVTPHLNYLVEVIQLRGHLNRLNEIVQMRGHKICFY